MYALSHHRGPRLLGAAAIVVLSLTVIHACAPGEQGPAGPPGALDEMQLDQLTAAIDAVLPTGLILPYAGDASDPSKVPAGFMLCNGDLVSRTTYAKLFAVIGIQYGGGDGIATFQLPDLRGEFIRGADAGRGVDAGRALGSSQAAAFPDHRHGIGGGYGTAAAGTESYGTGYWDGAANIARRTGLVADVTGETRPRNVALNYIIKL